MNIKQSLISSLKLIVFSVCISVVMSTALAAVYMIYMLCVNMVAGQQLAFDIQLFLEGLLLFLPLVLVLQAMLMTLFMIRHPESTVLPLAFYAAVYIAAWLFVLPAVVKTAPYGGSRYVGEHFSDKPSAGYFRNTADKILYYSSIDAGTSLANGMCVDTQKPAGNVFTFSNVALSQKRTVFTDSLIQNTIEMPASLSILVRYVQDFFVILAKCARESFGYWLCFASMALPLLAVVSLRRFSQWRLVSVISIIFVSIGVLVFNVLGYVNPAVVSVEDSINGVLTKIPPLKSLAEFGNLCVMLVNIIVFLILTAAFFAFEFKNRSFVEGAASPYGTGADY